MDRGKFVLLITGILMLATAVYALPPEPPFYSLSGELNLQDKYPDNSRHIAPYGMGVDGEGNTLFVWNYEEPLYEDLRGQFYDHQGNATSEVLSLYIGNAPRNSGGEELVMSMNDDGEFILRLNNDPLFQRYNADGTLQGDPFSPPLPAECRYFGNSAVALTDDDTAIVVFECFVDDIIPLYRQYDLFLVMYDADNQLLTPQPAIVNNLHDDGDQKFARIACDHDGNFVVAYSSRFLENLKGIDPLPRNCARFYLADGTPRGDEFRVSDINPGQEGNPELLVNDLGRFAICWPEYSSSVNGKYCRRYENDGTPGNLFFRDFEYYSRMALDNDGNLMMCGKRPVDGTEPDTIFNTYCLIYDEDNEPLTEEFLLHSTTDPSQVIFEMLFHPDSDAVSFYWYYYVQLPRAGFGLPYASIYAIDFTPVGDDDTIDDDTIDDDTADDDAVDDDVTDDDAIDDDATDDDATDDDATDDNGIDDDDDDKDSVDDDDDDNDGCGK